MSLVGVCVCMCVWRRSTASDDQLSVIHGMSDEIQVLKSKHQSFQDQYSTCMRALSLSPDHAVACVLRSRHFHAFNVMYVSMCVCVSGFNSRLLCSQRAERQADGEYFPQPSPLSSEHIYVGSLQFSSSNTLLPDFCHCRRPPGSHASRLKFGRYGTRTSC